jgi:hypothetical protein
MDADLRLEREGGRCVDSMNIEPPHEPRWACKRPKPWWRCHRRMVDRDSLGDGRVRVMASGLKDHETLGCCAKRPKHGRPRGRPMGQRPCSPRMLGRDPMRFSEGPSWEQRSRAPRIHEINAWNAALHSDFSLAEQASAGVVYRPEVPLAEQFLANAQ